MNENIKELYIALCSKKIYNGIYYISISDMKEKPFTVKNNNTHVINNWGLTCIDIYKYNDKYKMMGLLPENLWIDD